MRRQVPPGRVSPLLARHKRARTSISASSHRYNACLRLSLVNPGGLCRRPAPAADGSSYRGFFTGPVRSTSITDSCHTHVVHTVGPQREGCPRENVASSQGPSCLTGHGDLLCRTCDAMLLDFAFQTWSMAAGSVDTGLLVANALARLMSGPQQRLLLGSKVFHFPVEAAACENMVLLVAVDGGLRTSSGCRSVVDAAVDTGKQAAPCDSIDTLTPKCIEGLADLLAPYGLNSITPSPPAPGEAGAAQQFLFRGTAGCGCCCTGGP